MAAMIWRDVMGCMRSVTNRKGTTGPKKDLPFSVITKDVVDFSSLLTKSLCKTILYPVSP